MMNDDLPSKDRVMTSIVTFIVIFVVLAMVFFTYRDVRAVDRCEALGGQTWDSGQHCVIGEYKVVDTHDRMWG